MKARCLSPTATSYWKYGKVGIKIYEPWLIFNNFLKDMGIRPIDKTLDRIDPYGNYEPSNCRWATPTEQRRNRRMNRNNTSSYQGVYDTGYNTWRTLIAFSSINYHLGTFTNKEDAIMMRMAAEEQLLC